jgi:DNA-binding transcriptional regulator YiaG
MKGLVMANIGVLFSKETRRLARKEMKIMYPDLQKELSALKRHSAKQSRRLDTMEKILKAHDAQIKNKRQAALKLSTDEIKSARLSPGLIQKLRKRLKLSRKDFGKLAGVSSNTIYMWEKGKSAPSRSKKAGIIALRKIGVREAKKLLKA